MGTLEQDIAWVCWLNGEFTLRSGKAATRYFDKYRFESNPGLLRRVAGALTELIPPDTQILAGLEMGGIPIATALSLHTGLPVVFVRKQRKPYGTRNIIEGTNVAGKRVCVVEDVVTTGWAVIDGVLSLREAGAIIEHAVCVMQRGTADLPVNLHALFTEAAETVRSEGR